MPPRAKKTTVHPDQELRDRLGGHYERLVGHDPRWDDPDMPTSELQAKVDEYEAEFPDSKMVDLPNALLLLQSTKRVPMALTAQQAFEIDPDFLKRYQLVGDNGLHVTQLIAEGVTTRLGMGPATYHPFPDHEVFIVELEPGFAETAKWTDIPTDMSNEDIVLHLSIEDITVAELLDLQFMAERFSVWSEQ